MKNTQKAILLLNSIKYQKPDYLVVRDNKLFSATWQVDYHNGDIDNYKEKPVTEAEAAKSLPSLEKLYAEQAWEEYVKTMKAQFVKDLYANNENR